MYSELFTALYTDCNVLKISFLKVKLHTLLNVLKIKCLFTLNKMYFFEELNQLKYASKVVTIEYMHYLVLT